MAVQYESRETIILHMVQNEADMAYRRRVITIFDWLDPRDSDLILDGGCGRGFYLNFIRRTCQARLIGLELDGPIIRKAASALRHTDGTQLANGSLYAIPAPDNVFDKVILSEVLEHVPDEQRALSEIFRVLKPGGLLAITVPNANYPFWWDPINKTLETLFSTHIQNGLLAGIWANHERLYTREQLHRVVAHAGFDIVDERSFTHYSFPFIHNIVYGFGKTVLEAGLLPRSLAEAADRHNLEPQSGSRVNPVIIGLRIFEWFDRRNIMNEPAERSTVNLCVLVRKPESQKLTAQG